MFSIICIILAVVCVFVGFGMSGGWPPYRY